MLWHNDQQRTFAPTRMRNTDDGRLRDQRMGRYRVLDLDRGDPLAARLDDVLDAVGDQQIPAAVNGCHIAGIEPYVRSRLAEVATAYPRATYLQRTGGLAVVAQCIAGLIDDAHLDAEQCPA
ncbi:hypothetical protein D3C72_929560 [compost metagenome]